MHEPWTYHQAVAFLAYDSVEVAARYGGSKNATDGGKDRRARDLLYPLRPGLPGIDTVLAIKDPNERDIALHGTKSTTTQWRGAGLGKERPPGEQTIECRNRDGWEDADEERWRVGMARLYEAMRTGAVTAYRETAVYAPNGLIKPVPAETWKRGLAGVERCLFASAELSALVESHAKPELFEPAGSSAFEQFQARLAALRSFTILDATARIVHRDAYDNRYTTLPGDADAEQEAQHRRKHDKRYGSGLTIVTPSVGCESPGGAGAEGASRSRIIPPPKPEPAVDRPDASIEAKNKAKAAEAMAWGAAAQQLCDWMLEDHVESHDRDGNVVPKKFYHDVSNLREASARGYRVWADGFLAMIKGRTPAPAMPVGQAPVLYTLTHRPDTIELPTLIERRAPAAMPGPASEATSAASASKPRNSGGAPPTYDWPAFTRELIRVANLDGFATRQAMAAHMRAWVAVQWERQPDERTMQRKLADFYPADLPER